MLSPSCEYGVTSAVTLSHGHVHVHRAPMHLHELHCTRSRRAQPLVLTSLRMSSTSSTNIAWYTLVLRGVGCGTSSYPSSSSACALLLFLMSSMSFRCSPSSSFGSTRRPSAEMFSVWKNVRKASMTNDLAVSSAVFAQVEDDRQFAHVHASLLPPPRPVPLFSAD